MKIFTILSPQMFPLFAEEVKEKQVMVIDILRATTSMVVMLENGAQKVIPVAKVEEALAMKALADEQGRAICIAGERNGIKVDGFDFGNSPQEFTSDAVAGKEVVITTTNGTHALDLSKSGSHVWVGGFLNLSLSAAAIAAALNDVYLFCAGWKGHFNLEDTLFAGALAEELLALGGEIGDDATRAALAIWKRAKSNPAGFLSDASHVQRFQTMHATSDLEVCLQINTSKKAVKYENGELVAIPS
jgi:2-phosphosulfolactate phosphatase